MSKLIIGVDEVGWGCIAGPIVVCAAVVPEEYWQTLRDWGFRDSKQVGNRTKPPKDPKAYARSKDRIILSTGKCETLARRLEAEGRGLATWCIGQMDPDEINCLGPKIAKERAIRSALLRLMYHNEWSLPDVRVIMDGSEIISTLPRGLEQEAIPKADDTILPVSVASVIAKAYRDQQMLAWHDIYPERGFDSNKGYPTPKHTEVVFHNGLIPGLYRVGATKERVQNYYRQLSSRDRERFGRPPWLHGFGWLEEIEEEEHAKAARFAKSRARKFAAEQRVFGAAKRKARA